jgi:hypothetical protein
MDEYSRNKKINLKPTYFLQIRDLIAWLRRQVSSVWEQLEMRDMLMESMLMVMYTAFLEMNGKNYNKNNY